MGVQKGTLGHAADDLPEEGGFHGGLGHGEHHARVDGDVPALGGGSDLLFKRRGPYCAFFVLANVGYNGTCTFGDG